MLKASGALKNDGGTMIILGLSHENLSRLKAGKSLEVDMREFGYENGLVFLFSEETEQKMVDALVEMGVQLPS